jgi:nucleoside-triphosphatase
MTTTGPTAFLLTGRPGIGKTTVIQKTLALLGDRPVGGFYTREVREQGQRVGFELVTLDGTIATLATTRSHNFAQAQPFGRYTVNLAAIDGVGVPALRRAWQASGIVVIDEIGPMEILSRPFQEIVWQIVNSEAWLLATIVQRPEPFADRVKQRPNVRLIEVVTANRETLPERLAAELTRA